MASEQRTWKGQREDFWREAWKRSDLNQRQYCEFHGLPQKTHALEEKGRRSKNQIAVLTKWRSRL